ncbi:S1/P1 nuclease-domain-containing protein [Lineolata rhizophorae]|uniref:S1/P1 nuclease-domain-containing protein n=1 Tax=Lineolata rhizophorae TaxID=578093 RepID=A0A6A6NTL5_9PEZI|nr:S1/P1 nuclease-domain-containing protein [Lineolata rhizophorae]
MSAIVALETISAGHPAAPLTCSLTYYLRRNPVPTRNSGSSVNLQLLLLLLLPLQSVKEIEKQWSMHYAVPLSLCVFLSQASTVAGWGFLGHRTVAFLAEKYLTPAAAELVADATAYHPFWDISDGAIWADWEGRRKYEESGPWHYIDALDNPPERCGITWPRDCGSEDKPGCVVSAITNLTLSLTDPDFPSPLPKNETVLFLIHFLGDIAQPLHTENMSRGGNGIHVDFDGRRNSLHSVWDTDIPRKARGLHHDVRKPEEKAAAKAWAEELYALAQREEGRDEEERVRCRADAACEDVVPDCVDVGSPQACALLWAGETNCYVCDYVLSRSVVWLENNDLGGEYFEGAAPIVAGRIKRAGVRLGAWLNELAALDDGSSENGRVDEEGQQEPLGAAEL